MSDKSLEFHYENSVSVRDRKLRIRDCTEGISLGFHEYEKPHTKGPGLYFAIVSGRSVAAFAEPMGSNYWPMGTCSIVGDDVDSFYAAAKTVAQSRDGGVCIGVDGTVLKQMVRFKNVRDDELPDGVSVTDLEYADWMGARHMSAYETSLRPEVITTITLSEETGRVTTFQNGRYETVTRSKIGMPWRKEKSE